MSISNSYPTQRPSLNLVFNGGSNQLDSRISYTRSSSGTAFSAERHLSSLNLTSNSEDFSAWSKTNATASANTTAAPDGNTTASTMTGNAGTSVKFLSSNSPSVTAPVISVYAKSGTHSYIQISDNANTQEYANFDLANGTVGNVGTLATAAIEAVGSTGWYRCIMRVERTSAAFTWRVVMIDSSTAARQSTTSSTGTVHLWGGMMTELGDLTNVVAYQPSGSQIHRSFAPTLKTSQSDQPRFEYDPAADGQSVGSGTALGLLVESQATNLAPNSELDSGYSTVRLTTSAGACVGPTGALAQVFTETTEDGNRYIADAFATVINYSTAYTASVYAKKVASGTTDSRIKFRLNGMGGAAHAAFDLVNGTVTQQAGPAIDSATISSVGNGWYRISMTWTNEAADRASGIIVAFNNNTPSSLASYVGDGFTSYALAGLMVEQGSSPSSLISTSGASASRASDSCSVADFGYTGGAVSITTEVTAAASADGTQRVFTLFEGSDLVSAYFSGGGDIKTFVDVGGGTQVDASILADAVSGTDYKVGISFDTNDYRGVSNGTLGAADTSCTLPNFSSPTLQIGAQSGGTNPLSGHIKRVSLFNVALSDVELQSLTSS